MLLISMTRKQVED